MGVGAGPLSAIRHHTKCTRTVLMTDKSASFGRLNKPSLIKPLRGISDETPCQPDGAQVCLRSAFHEGRTTGLPCSASVPEWVRSALSADSAYGHEKRHTNPSTGLLTFWSKPLSAFGLPSITTFIRRSHVLTLPLHPSSGPHWH
jgi:hypothetical protein